MWKEVGRKEQEGGKGRQFTEQTWTITFMVLGQPYKSAEHFPTGQTVTVEFGFILLILEMVTSARTGAMLCIWKNDCIKKPIPSFPLFQQWKE